MFSQVSACRSRRLFHAGIAATTFMAIAAGSAAQSIPAPRAKAVADYDKLPLRFEANRGQAASSVDFLTHGNGYGLYFTDHEAVLSLNKPNSANHADIVRIQVAGSNATAPLGNAQLPGIVNYIQSSDPSSWKTNIPTFAEVRYPAVYPGIDLVYYGNQQQLEYDFIVAPHANAGTIRLHFDGARHLALDAEGNLVIEAHNGSIAFHKPVLYQTIAGKRRDVSGAFTLLADNTAGFHLGAYDRNHALVIDPTLLYSTYIGGTIQDSVTAMAVDASGNAYLTGTTETGANTAPDFPVTGGAYNTTGYGAYYAVEAFVSKLNASGSALLYSTYLGPSATTAGIAIDSSGDAYITGTTTSTTYPTTSGAYQTVNKATSGDQTGFVTKLNPTGTALVFSTFFGGSNYDSPTAIALNSAGDIYLAGTAFSTDFPTTSGAYQTTNKAAPYGWNDFVTELNPAATALVFSTLIGGTDEYSQAPKVQLALDSSGDTYIASYSLAPDFPTTTGAYQTTSLVKSGYTSITLSKFNPAGTKLLYSTWFDGTGSTGDGDIARGIAVNSAGNLYIAGITYEVTFPTTSGALQTTNKTGGGQRTTGFITEFNATGSGLVYSTYLGGSSGEYQGDYINSLALDSSGDVYVGGMTGSLDFPVTFSAYQSTNLAADNNGAVPFLTEINPAGSALVYSTYFGSTDSYQDAANTIALGPNSSVYIAGAATPTYLADAPGPNDFPITTGALQTTSDSQEGSTGFVAKFDLGTAPSTIATATYLSSSANPAATGSTQIFTATVTPNTGTTIPTGNVVFSVDEGTGTSVALNAKGVATYSPAALSVGTHYILASYAGTSTYAASAQGLNESITPAAPTVAPAGGVYTSAQLITLADTTGTAVIYYTLDGSAPTSSSTKYTAPFLVSTTLEVSAIAIASGIPASAVAHATYSFLNAPYVLAAPASAITTTGATLNAVVSTGGMAGSYSFAYGTSSTALTSTTPATSFGGSVLGKLSIAPFQATAILTTLTTKTTYYFKVIVTTTAGASSGEVLSFKTN